MICSSSSQFWRSWVFCSCGGESDGGRRVRGNLAKLFAEVDAEAWVRFAIALLGLLFSFGFAVLSTSFRDQGNLVGTAISASLALLTAVVVGVATIPYLT